VDDFTILKFIFIDMLVVNIVLATRKTFQQHCRFYIEIFSIQQKVGWGVE